MDDYERYERATADLEPPFALVDLGALWDNADDLVSRAKDKPVRVASKSVRCRSIQDRVLAREGFSGTLAFSLPEALWLTSHGTQDIVVAYPSTDRRALRDLAWAMGERPSTTIAIMVDSIDHLDLIDEATGPRGVPLRVCLDIDAGYRVLGGRVRIGAKRSPVREPGHAEALARTIVERPGFELVGIMAYEAQIAGVGDHATGKPLRSLAIRGMQRRSAVELTARRAKIVAAVKKVTDLEFVNGGGTGSLETTATEDAVTEVAAGSGLFGPGLFDDYSAFTPHPAAMFALSVVRRPAEGVVTLLGGGYLASGTGTPDRLPRPFLPKGLRLDANEGAGEVQTPVLGEAADAIPLGGRVYLRHAKAGELCERFSSLYLVEGDSVVDEVPTYRGEGKTFL